MPYALATLPGWPGGLIVGMRNGTVLLGENHGAAFTRLDADIRGILTLSAVPLP